MARQYQLKIAQRRSVGAALVVLDLEAPELVASARAGQFVMLRCTDQGSFDPLLRRPFWVAGVARQEGCLRLLCRCQGRGGHWLANRPVGAVLDIIGPLGQPFSLAPRTRTLLLIGDGAGVPALLPLAEEALARKCAVTLLLADEPACLPAFLLPAEVEYHTGVTLLALAAGAPSQSSIFNLQSSIQWADQLCAALPDSQLGLLATAVRTVAYRWERGFAQVALRRPLACGLGACGNCTLETRKGWQIACTDGLVFDLRDLLVL